MFEHHATSPMCRLATYSWLIAWKLTFALHPEPSTLIKWIRHQSTMGPSLELCFAYLLAPANPHADIAFTHIPTTAGALVESSPADHLMVALPELAQHGITCTRLGVAGLDFLQQVMTTFPSMVRSWWTSTERPVADLVEKFVTRHISPRVISAELEGIQV